jgi:hypothetical protein
MGLSGGRRVERWVHLDERGGDPWILPVWTALNEAAKAGRCAPRTKDLSELGVHISTRLTLLPTVVRRVNLGARKLYAAVAGRAPRHEFTRDSEGVVFCVDDDAKYELLADLDSLLFEFHSACELMVRLFEHLHIQARKAMPASSIGKSIQSVLKSAGQDPAWFAVLGTNRNFFLHEGAPYIAVDVSQAPEDYDLLIMKENLKMFEDRHKFIKLSEINEMVQGFRRSRSTVQSYLSGLFAP